MAHNNRRPRQPGPPPPAPFQGPSPLPLACPPGNDYPSELLSLLETPEVMKKHGYVMQLLTDAELQEKARCRDCNQPISSLRKGLQKTLQHRRDQPVPPPPNEFWDPLPTLLIPMGGGKYKVQTCTVPCRFHLGTVEDKTRRYNCCDSQPSGSKPCFTSDQHTIRDYAPDELVQCYQFFTTPTPLPAGGVSFRAAVAIDCEMGTAITADSELIRLTAIDYLTGEVLINNLVQPDQQMLHLNTRYSGVTWKQMREAKRNGTSLNGKAGAREALWRFVGPSTALVGHGVNNDLRALKWIHHIVIDSYMIEDKIVQAKKLAAEKAAAAAVAEAASTAALAKASAQQSKSEISSSQATAQPKKKTKGTGDLALKTLMKKYLGRDIQMQGNKGHDSFEDALAARDLVHCMVMRRLKEKGLVV